MTVVNKIKQIGEWNIRKLTLLAKADGKKTDHEIARWIIAHSIHWRTEGYKRIIEELEKL